MTDRADLPARLRAGRARVAIKSRYSAEDAALDDEAAARIEVLEAALKRSMLAIDDWLNLYASDHCDEARVREAQERVMQFGTIAYIANVQEQNRAALSALAAPVRDEPRAADERGWLVEMQINNEPWWWAIDLPNEENWTKDSLKALRFGRREDAESFIRDAGWTEVVATEHMWSDPSPRALSQTSKPEGETR